MTNHKESIVITTALDFYAAHLMNSAARCVRRQDRLSASSVLTEAVEVLELADRTESIR